MSPLAAFCLHERTHKQVAMADMMAVVCVGDDVFGMLVDDDVFRVMNVDDENDTSRRAAKGTSSI